MKNYYYLINGVQGGPVTFEGLKNVGINVDTLIWCEGMAEWLPASQVPYVAAIANAAAKQQQAQYQQAYTNNANNAYAAPAKASMASDAYIVYGLAATIACCILIPVAQLFL